MAGDSAEHVINEVDLFGGFCCPHCALPILLPYEAQNADVRPTGDLAAVDVEADEGSIEVCFFSILIHNDDIFRFFGRAFETDGLGVGLDNIQAVLKGTFLCPRAAAGAPDSDVISVNGVAQIRNR